MGITWIRRKIHANNFCNCAIWWSFFAFDFDTFRRLKRSQEKFAAGRHRERGFSCANHAFVAPENKPASKVAVPSPMRTNCDVESEKFREYHSSSTRIRYVLEVFHVVYSSRNLSISGVAKHCNALIFQPRRRYDD